MGFNITDTIDLMGDGTDRANVYVTCKMSKHGSTIRVMKNADATYRYSVMFYWYNTQEDYNDNLKPVKQLEMYVDNADGNLPPATTIYARVKSDYTTTVDV